MKGEGMNTGLMRIAVITVLVGGLGACAGLSPKSMDARVADIAGQIEETVPPLAPPVVTRHEGVWLTGRAVPLAEPEPAVLRKRIRLASAAAMDLRHIARRITQAVGVPVDVTPDVFASSGDEDADAALNPGKDRIEVHYDGPLRGLLDEVTSRYGVTWRHDGGRIQISRLVTRVFEVHVLPGETTFSASVGGRAAATESTGGTITSGDGSGGAAGLGSPTGGGGLDSTLIGETGGGGGDDVSQSTTRNMRLGQWDAVQAVVESMLTPLGRMSGSASTGVIAVTDTPASVVRIGHYLEAENVRSTRQVAIYAKVLTLTREDGGRVGLNLEAIYRTANAGVDLVTPDVVSNAGSLSVSLLRPTSPFRDSRAVIEAIAERSHGATLTTASVVTLNGHPAPVQVTRTEGFLKSVATTVVEGSGTTTTSITPGQVTTGFVMTATPRVVGENRILMSYTMDISSLLGFVTESSGGQSIRVPNLDKRTFSQSVSVRSGDVLVLSGFEQQQARVERTGVGDAENWWSGGRDGAENDSRIVVLLTPVLVGDGRVAVR